MYIVGSSGHIDHGKTSLIKALTDIDCDRLPEEKKREMTIDIGFASINYPKFGNVSIIDVPGHERFIRNMVVGAWGIDLALLVIAVDDGWMPQTEDHYRVLQLLNVERIIVLLNKIDLADDEMIEFVKEEVKEKIENTRYHDSDIIHTSAKTGQGIEQLKDAILANLRKLSKALNSNKPYLFVDRVFASKGYGTVITGTLKNGIFNEDDTVLILPEKKDARIKRIESHYNVLGEGSPSQRTALNLSGVNVDDLKRGCIVIKDNFFTESNDILVKLEMINYEKELKNNLGIEILIGTSSLKGKIILIHENIKGTTLIVRIKFENNWFFYPGQPFVITNPGGYRVIGGGLVIFPAYKNKLHRYTIKSSLGKLEKFDTAEIAEFVINVNRWIKRETLVSMFPHSNKILNKTFSLLIERGSVLGTGNYLITDASYAKAAASIVDIIRNNIGLNLKEISDMSKIDLDLCKVIIPDILKKYTLAEKDGRYFSGDAITEDTLSETYRSLLKELLSNGSSGVELDRIDNDRRKKNIKELIKLDFLVSLDGNIVYHKKIYESHKEKIMKLFDKLDKISLAEAREVVGLSRKYLIPLLNRIEGDGLIKRIGDFRIKV